MDWFLYDNGPRHERVTATLYPQTIFLELAGLSCISVFATQENVYIY